MHGLNLSDRVWQYTDQFKDEIEMALDLGIKEGKSATSMSMDVRQYLQNPNMLFRRVRDKRGLLQLSKRAKAFHPGQGVYRSSYKNARRLTATENNIAYRTADYLRYQQMDFVVGIQICLSNNHTVLLQPGETTADPTQQRADGSPKANAVKHLVDICDDLQGRYPKDFKFTGWHPHCRCHVITILKSKDEIKRDIKRLANGETVDNTSVNEVTELPKNFTEWVQNNEERLKGRATLPYFIKDNQRQVNGILGIEEPKKKELSLFEIAKQRHAKRTQEQVDDIKRRYWQRFEPDYLSDEQKAANIEAYLQIEKDLGIKRGKPMTFTEANEMKGNPHFGENEGYRINCQTCVVAHELRLRGFDVSALANTKGSALEKLSRATHTAWQGLNKEDIPIFAKKTLDKRGYIRFPKINWKQVSDATSAPGRYHIAWTWKRNHEGHIITIERLSDGKIRFYDPQTGELDIFSRYKKDIAGGIRVYRVDTLTPNTSVVKNVLAKYEAKAVTGEVSKNSITGYIDFSKVRILRQQALTSDEFELKGLQDYSNLFTEKILLKFSALKNTVNHCINEEELAALKYVWANPDKLKYKRISEMGEGKNLKSEKDIKNIRKKQERGVVDYIVYEIEIPGLGEWVVKTERTKRGYEQFYHIRKK